MEIFSDKAFNFILIFFVSVTKPSGFKLHIFNKITKMSI